MPVIGNKNINIIQGDTYTREVTLQNVDIELIKDIYFSCSALSLCKKLEYEEETKVFNLTFTSKETKELPKGIYNYDLTIEFVQETFKTVQYKSTITVLEKNNKVVC